MDLHKCCKAGDLQRLRQLIAENADLNGKNRFGQTPLHIASSYIHVELVEELLKYNVHINEKANEGWTALHHACTYKRLGYFEDARTVHKQDQLKIVQMLIEHDAHVNAQKDDGYTPLHVASLNNEFEIVKILIPYSDRSLKTITGRKASELGTNYEMKKFIENYQDIPEINP